MRVWLLLLLLAVGGCPTLDRSRILCAADTDCPEGWVCSVPQGSIVSTCSDPNAPVGDDDDAAGDDDDATEPLDPYTCGWPRNDDAAGWTDPGFGGGPTPGERVPAYVGQDACGDEVALWDFGRDGRPVLLVFTVWWSGPGITLAEALDGDGDPFEYLPAGVADAVAAEEIWVVHLLAENELHGQPADQGDVFRFQQDYGDSPAIAVLTDEDGQMFEWSGSGYYPATIVLNQSMEVLAGPGDDINEALDVLASLL
jgi:hypothetical protein